MNNLKGYRGKYGITQEQLAEQLGIRANAYAQKENGQREWKLGEIKVIVDFFKRFEPRVTVEQIFFNE